MELVDFLPPLESVSEACKCIREAIELSIGLAGINPGSDHARAELADILAILEVCVERGDGLKSIDVREQLYEAYKELLVLRRTATVRRHVFINKSVRILKASGVRP